MTTLFWRVYRKGERVPANFVAKVHAASAEDAIRVVKAQPAYKGKDFAFVAVPAHAKAGK